MLLGLGAGHQKIDATSYAKSEVRITERSGEQHLFPETPAAPPELTSAQMQANYGTIHTFHWTRDTYSEESHDASPVAGAYCNQCIYAGSLGEGVCRQEHVSHDVRERRRCTGCRPRRPPRFRSRP